MVSHDDLLVNPTLLLKNQPPVDSLTSELEKDLDWAYAAAVLDDGYSCITTTSNELLAPPLGGNREIRERDDYFFLDDDYLVWPQPYNPSRPHLPFIAKRTVAIERKESLFLWTLPERSQFHLVDQDSFTGLGKLAFLELAKFIRFHEQLVERYETNLTHFSAEDKQAVNRVRLYTNSLLSRLRDIPTGFRALCRSVRTLQRFLLEFEAWNEYVLYFRRLHIDIVPSVDSQPKRTVGAFVYNAEDMSRFRAMGVDCWYIRPYQNVLNSRVSNILSLTHPEHYGLSSLPTNIAPVFVGSASDPRVYKVLVDFGLGCIRFPDPFHAIALPEPLCLPSGPSRPARGSHRALTEKQRQKFFASSKAQKRYENLPRSKFGDPTCSFYPPGIPIWQQALLSVDTSSDRFLYQTANSDTGYVVPEPAFMVGTKIEEKSKAMFRAWLRYRPILIFRLSFPSSRAEPKHGRAWSTILAKDYGFQNGKDQTPGSRAKERERLLEEMKSFLNVASGSDVQVSNSLELASSGAAWHGIPFEDLQEEHFEQILWELAEINFRFEFQALDRRARLGTPFESLVHVDSSLAACVPDPSFAVPSLSTANHGLASLSTRERSHYLFAMARVMSKWRSVSSEGWIVQTEKLHWDPKELEALEVEVASVYTQLFHDCFRRAPVIFRWLSEKATSALPSAHRVHEPQLSPHITNNPMVILNVTNSLQ